MRFGLGQVQRPREGNWTKIGELPNPVSGTGRSVRRLHGTRGDDKSIAPLRNFYATLDRNTSSEERIRE